MSDGSPVSFVSGGVGCLAQDICCAPQSFFYPSSQGELFECTQYVYSRVRSSFFCPETIGCEMHTARHAPRAIGSKGLLLSPQGARPSRSKSTPLDAAPKIPLMPYIPTPHACSNRIDENFWVPECICVVLGFLHLSSMASPILRGVPDSHQATTQQVWFDFD